jgi:hypothetical protein
MAPNAKNFGNCDVITINESLGDTPGIWPAQSITSDSQLRDAARFVKTCGPALWMIDWQSKRDGG